MLFYGFVVWTDKQKEKRHTFATQTLKLKPYKRINYRDVLDTLIFVLFDAYFAESLTSNGLAVG